MLDFEKDNLAPTAEAPIEPILLVDPADYRRLRPVRLFPWKITAAALTATLVGTGIYGYCTLDPDGPPYRLDRVERGDLLVTVMATGSIQPVVSVPVGAQVTGRIQALHADFNSRVKAGQILAEIDPALYRSRLDQDRAGLEHARADVERVRAGLVQADKELRRARQLTEKDLIAPAEADAALAAYDSLVAQLKIAQASVTGAQAAVEASEVNLKYCTILSPIDGLVLSRNVDVGQTVATGLQAPTLFILSGRLSELQIQASVSEADIGRIREGQKVKFTVEAYRDDSFKGRVSSLRMSSTTIQNVVTYTVIIECENLGAKLLPGMTAQVSFLLSEHKGVLRVPNAAFRFKPEPQNVPAAPAATAREGSSAPTDTPTRRNDPPRHRLWCLCEGKVIPKDIECGETDGTRTLVLGSVLREGDEVITGIVQAGTPAATVNPFAPAPKRRPR